jgi:D-alanine--poly(phosphoribitol) ligase subunit 1
MVINILEYLENSASIFPNKVAFSDQKNEITYSEIIQQAKAIGSKLTLSLDGETKKPIAVFIDRNISSLVSFLGVVYSGNFYVPIDGQMPQNRIELILNTLQPPSAILMSKDCTQFVLVKPLFFDDLIHETINELKLAKIRCNSIDTDPLYIMFTSGSTGVPKGTVVCHRSVIDLIEHFKEIFRFSEESVFGNQAPFDFDVSVKDIYSTLKNGATMHIIPKVLFSFPTKLIEYLNIKQINTTIWATSALRIVANLKALEVSLPKYLEKVMFSGEVMPIKVLNYWRKYLPDVLYVNLYGPTEITCNCTYYIVDRSFSEIELLPIGIPFPNTDVFLLNAENKLVNLDDVGEICVRGTSLALGYYNNDAAGIHAFCQNPLNSAYPELVYRTGDLGRYNDSGELIFLSRKDSQIKHMGHRIELGEIEVAVNALDFIHVACCLYDSKKEIIILFYQSDNLCNKELLLALRDYLPKYMLPNKLIHFEKIPMNKNAKIDRVKLREQYIDQPSL